MKTYQVVTLHLEIFAAVGGGILVIELASRLRRSIHLLLELRQIKETI